jgi:N-methylhydantoinase B/oxoprolinase/acetone carboxylase alpha subunit
MADILVVVSKIKKMVKEQGLRTGEDYINSLSSKVEQMVKQSIEKVKSEGKKKTLGAEDLA